MILSRAITSSPSRADHRLLWFLRGLAGMTGLIVVFIIIFLLIEAIPGLRKIGIFPFFTDPTWHPVEGVYNLSPMLLGTVYATAGSVIVATPLAITLAIFRHFYAPPAVAFFYQKGIELLAGIPSVVYGLWGLVILVPLIAQVHPPGSSLLAGIVILTVMILPTATLAASASFEQVPRDYLYGAAALGIDRWSIIRSVILPSAKSGVLTGIILQTGRAIGETMAILMVSGNVVQTPTSLFDPIRTLTANIALEMGYAVGKHRSALFVSGLILLFLVVTLTIAADFISRERVYEK